MMPSPSVTWPSPAITTLPSSNTLNEEQHGNGAAPFKTVLTHGFMVDADREKISKSKQAAYELQAC